MNRILRTRADQGASKRGGALVASLALVVFIASMGAGLVQVVSSTSRRQAMGIDSMRALYVAEAGLAEGYLALAQGKTGDVGTSDELASYGGGLFWVTAEKLPKGLVRLVSNGLYGRGRSTLSVVLEAKSNPVGSLGISSLGQIEVGAGATVNSTDTSAPMTAAGDAAQLRGNGDILLHSIQNTVAGMLPGESSGSVDDEFPDSDYSGAGNTTILGDVRPGVLGTVQYESGTVITGSTAPSVQPIVTPAVKIPKGDPLTGSLLVNSSHNITGVHRIADVSLQSNADLTITGPARIVLGNFSALSGANLTIDSSAGPVEIFVKGDLNLQSGSTLANIGSDPTQVALVVGAPARAGSGELPIQTQKILSAGTFQGLVYAPYSQLKLGGKLNLVGAASAGQLHLGPGANVTYDAALKSAGVGVTLKPRQVAWTVEPLTDDPLMQSTGDAVSMMNLLGRTSIVAADSHFTYDAQLQYTDLGGIAQVYTGDIRVMDWTVIQSVDSVSWDDAILGTYGPAQQPKIVVEPDASVEPDTMEILDTLSTPL